MWISYVIYSVFTVQLGLATTQPPCSELTVGADYLQSVQSHDNFGTTDYAESESSCWHMSSDTGGGIRVTSDNFDLQDVSVGGQCSDWVKVYAGTSTSGGALYTLCGNSSVDVSTDADALIWFSSNADGITATGFELQISSHASKTSHAGYTITISAILMYYGITQLFYNKD